MCSVKSSVLLLNIKVKLFDRNLFGCYKLNKDNFCNYDKKYGTVEKRGMGEI